ncbi:MAG: hypothetical protein ACQKBV_08855 [Puniceicoccales bacterium]
MPTHADIKQTLAQACPIDEAAEASLAVAWERVFDCLCEHAAPTIAECNTLSGIIQKLSSAQSSLKTLALKVRESELKQHEHEAKRAQLEKAVAAAKRAPGLTAETLAEIEQRLNLM